MAQVRQTASNQSPFAAIVGCIDSRVTPELVFDQRIGEVFCARVAGNIVNTDIIGSLECSTKVAGAKAIIGVGT
jgi:carbonic anhydrase